jgi:hypothetical protein
VPSSTYNDEEETLKAKQIPYPPNPKPSFNPKRAQKQTTNSSMPNLDGVYTCMFCGRAGHLDKFCFRHKRIERRRVEYARGSYRDEFILILVFCLARTLVLHLTLFHVLCLALLLVLCLSSLMDLTIAHMVWVHERTVLCLDALDMVHVLIMMIVCHVGLVSLLERLTLTLSQDIWTAHIFSIVVHIPLGQMVSCKGL